MKKGLTYRIPYISSRTKFIHSTALLLLLLHGSVRAQTGTSSVSGQVLDPEGRAVAGTTVSLISVETKIVRTQNTNESGGFVFNLIPPGSYRLEAEAQGFKKAILKDIRALVAKPTEVTLRFEIGSIKETITVSAATGESLVNNRDASIGNNFVSEQLTQLPIESRNVVQLLSLQPGVTPDGFVTGSRSDQANVTLDGVDINEQQTGLSQLDGAAFASVLRVTPDSIQEFRVTTSNPNAIQGRSSGAQVSLVTKSGTNDLHGSLYEFHRNTLTSANDFFNNRSGVSKPKLLRNVFGGAVGGPIRKERAFFFYTYEGRRDSSEATVVRDVPLMSLGRGEVRFPNDSGGVTTLSAADIDDIFPAGVNPLAIAALGEAARKYPANDQTVGDGFNTGGFRFNASTPLSWNTHIARLDFTLTEDASHLLFIRGNYQQDLISAAPQFPDTPGPQFWNHPLGFVVSHTWVISDKLVNNFHYGLTRLAFSSFGDSSENDISFRFVFSPRLVDADGNPAHTLTRTTPVHNLTDDFSYIRGDHSFQFGTNIRLIRNNRVTFANAFDSAITNPSFYDFSGAVLSDPIQGIAPGFTSPVQNAVSAVIGRFSEYSANFNFDSSGNLLPSGSGVKRSFATQEYDLYIQDSWKLHANLTLTLGLRYGLSRPVYEVNGVQVRPAVGLGDFFERRKQSALSGTPLNELITVDLAGPANGRQGYYNWDKNNFQPRVAVAWTPDFKRGLLGKILGPGGKSVLRGGFAITNDNIGQQLAVQFDLNSTLGFSSTQTIAANTFNVTDRLAPRFTGFGQDVRGLPLINPPASLVFPLITPPDGAQRIESSLDDTITTPTNYSWNLSYGRNMPAGIFVEASYIGRAARNLLATRDIMALNNIVDPQSKLDWYTAAGMLHDLREKNTAVDKVPRIAYFENLFPRDLGQTLAVIFDDPTFSNLTPTQSVFYLVSRDGFNILDWTFVQTILDDLSKVGPNLFFHPQYAALSTFSTVASSDYHAGTLSVRQRYKESLYLDFNYTFSKSMDNASGLQTSDAFGAAFILNPLRPDDSRAVSDFDIRHVINANGVWQVPVGRGRMFLNDLSGISEVMLGGWQLSGVFRWNSGLPVRSPFDAAQWATNWNVQSFGVRTVPIKSSPTRGGATAPNLFSDPIAAYRSFRNARPGETGDRNVLRLPGFVSLDMGLGKSFAMPWSESHSLQFRWEVFNVTNTQRLTITTDGITRETFGLAIDPQLATPSPVFGNLNAIQGSPRVMQFGLRYSF